MRRTFVRETTFDLYVERDQLPGYFRVIALISAWVSFVGYMLFAVAFSVADADLNASRNTLTAVASALLIVGYLTEVAIALFSNSLLFLLDGVVYPILTTSIMGLLLTALTYALHVTHPELQVYMSIPLVTSCVTTTVTSIILVIVYREKSQIKRRDERRRWHVAMGPYGENTVNSHQRSMSGPEDDAQRRQLMRLLNDRYDQPSMEETQGTYKIDLPGNPRFESRGRSPPTTRRFNLSNLLPWLGSNNGTFKDARERRREEIERSGLQHSPNAGVPRWSRSRSASREPGAAQGQAGAPTAWGWPPATRYA